ncbi:hypothetical protein QBC39DRAFT_354713 [Podospora conica]|nr:hypothetical protein QBC39DRAFT_354713 [Schizothecium conicum]
MPTTWPPTFRTQSRRRTKMGRYELQARDPHSSRNAFLSACCAAGDAPRCALDEGLGHFSRLTETRMLAYQDATAGLLETLWARASRPELSYLERQLETCAKIVTAINTAVTHQTTIDDIANQVFQGFQVPVAEREHHRDVLRHLVFAAMGWSTLLFTPTFTQADADFSQATRSHAVTRNSAKHTLTQSSQRPLGAMLRSRGLMPIACPPGLTASSSQGLPTLLTVTHLNFFSLSRLGDITITWIDDISRHCEFDRYSPKKELRLFRLPSLCAMLCLTGKEEMLLDQLFKFHVCMQSCRSHTETVARSYLIEILLSYRLLFGQHHRSRQLFRKHERAKVKRDGAALDPLLDALCGDRDMADFGGTKSLLRERGVYNAQTNFPHLGAHLMELQDYSTCQRPRNIREVWNDERDPERLLTFKALVIIGALSISLSIIQVIVGLVQIVLAAQPPAG